MNNQLPKGFEDFAQARQEGFLKVKKYKEDGIKVVGTYCTFTPKEVIYAAGAVPIGLCGTSDETITEAEKHLPRNLCPLIKASYGFGITDKCPYFYFADMLVAETTCDGKKKMYELMSEIKPMHILNLPNIGNTEEAKDLWKNEVARLKNRLEKEFDITITDENLKDAIKLCNDERRNLESFYSLMKMTPPPMTGTELIKVLYGTTFSFDKVQQNIDIDALKDKLLKEYGEGNRPVSENAPRILVTGCPLGGVTEKLIAAIEEAGAVIVCFENCTGIREKRELVDESKDPVEAIAEKYLNIPCACMMNNDGRFRSLDELIEEYKVDGVIEVLLQSCHPFSVESHKVKQFVNEKKNLPYLALETDYFNPDSEQNRTRINAFMELL